MLAHNYNVRTTPLQKAGENPELYQGHLGLWDLYPSCMFFFALGRHTATRDTSPYTLDAPHGTANLHHGVTSNQLS